MELSTHELIYMGIVLGLGGFAVVRTLRFLGAARRVRLRSIERRRRFQAVRTGTPLDNPRDLARERGMQSIESHFSVMRRLVVPIIVAVSLLLASVPLLADASASTASLLGAVAAAVLGLALRPYLENAVAGLVISTSRLVRLGDTVRLDGHYGTVEDITVTHTAIKVWDWRRYLVPNARMLQSTFVNYTLFDSFHWCWVEFFVAPDADLELVERLARQAPLGSSCYVDKEPPSFWVHRIEKDAICCWVAAWAESPARSWTLGHDIRMALMTALREHGVPLSLQRFERQPPREGERGPSDDDGPPRVPGPGRLRDAPTPVD